MSEASAHIDGFARDRLPPREQWPVFDLDLPLPRYPPRLNCGVELLDRMVAAGHGDRPVLVTPTEKLTYRQLLERANRMARVLTEDLGLVPGHLVLIAFTSGTTGKPKGTMHFHRDVLAICDCFPRFVLKPRADDVFIGSPPIAFTFGLGGLVTFPMRVGASTVLIETPTPDNLLQAMAEFRATICFTAPTAYRRLADKAAGIDISGLRRCVSAGETLPLPTFEAWRSATGLRIIDGIGATEMLHIFIAAADDDIRPGPPV